MFFSEPKAVRLSVLLMRKSLKDPSSRIGNIMWSAEGTLLDVFYPVSQFLSYQVFQRSFKFSGFQESTEERKTKVNVGPGLSND